MIPTVAIFEELQSLQTNPFVQDLLSALDARTRDSVLTLLASLEEDVLEGVLEAIEQLDRSDTSVDRLVAILKGRHISSDLDDRCHQALQALYKAGTELASNRSQGDCPNFRGTKGVYAQ